MPLFRLLPGRPRRIFSSLTCFLGGIFFFLAEAYVRTDAKETQIFRAEAQWAEEGKKQGVRAAAGRARAGIKEEKEKARERVVGGVLQ